MWRGVQLKEISNTEEKVLSFIAYLSSPGGNDSKRPAAAMPRASSSAGCLGSSQNNVKYVALDLEIVQTLVLPAAMLVTSRCFKPTPSPPPMQQCEDDDEICPDKDGLQLASMPNRPSLRHVHPATAQSLQESANFFRGLPSDVKSPEQESFRLLCLQQLWYFRAPGPRA